MDPLSVTSGIVGIVAFAFQLAKTASKVRKAVEEIKSAPKEARDLIDRLIMLETACQIVTAHLDRRKALANQSLPPSLDIISRALAQLLAKAQELEQMLSSFSSSSRSTSTLRHKLDTAGASRVRLVLRKDKINSLVQEIDRVTSQLQFLIQVDMWTLTSSPQQLLSLSSNGTELTNEFLNLEGPSRTVPKDSLASQCTLRRKAQQSRNQQSRTFRYLGYVSWTITDDWIGDDDEDDAGRVAHRTGSIAVRLPRTSTLINLQYHVGIGTPSYALNVVHIIEMYSDLGQRLWQLMEPGSDRRKLHELVSERKLSIYSRIRLRDWEMNLFFMAVNLRWAEGCRYLLEQDFRHEFEEANTPECTYTNGHITSGASEVTEIFLSARSEDTLEADMKYLLSVAEEPEYIVRYLELFMKSPGIDCANLLSHTWKALIINIFRYGSVSSWIPVLQCLIEHGIDIHQQLKYGQSAYMTLVWRAKHPFTADDRAFQWLNMLKACGVDLVSYVRTETELIQKVGHGGRSVVLLDYDGLQIPSWRWYLPTEGSAVDGLGEFANLGSELEDHHLRYSYLFDVVVPTGPDDIKAWKLGKGCSDTFWANEIFPFYLSPIDCMEGPDGGVVVDQWYRSTYNRAVEIRDKRLARRQAKKWRKAHPGERPPSDKMPGTWVD